MAHDPLWPAITSTSKPWTRWWWLGNAVNEAEITRHLQLFREAGFGGVEISPIYGVTGEEGRYVPFLSPRWIDLLRYTVREARRLHMDVDLISGTGWPFGGPWVSAEDAAAKVLFESYTLAAGDQIDQPIRSTTEPEAVLRALVAYERDGQVIDLHAQVDAQRRLEWIAPDGQWRVYAVFQTGTGQQVKRAAPGGEGNVVDHFSAAAIERYLDRFDQAFAGVPGEEQVRCFFNDSYEVYEANWADALFVQFQARRGYDLRHYLPALCGQDDQDTVSRVRSDYRQTIAEVLLDGFVQQWTDWAHRHGAMARNQAHGSPGNVLDLYAAADIPETETFGPDWMRLAGLAPMPGTPPQQGGHADILLGKFASSAAHVAGKPLCSSESFTWLDEHGKTPLAHMKAEVDLAFLMGINHLFFHGTPFSPADAAWPGWLFYASTHVAPTNPFWRDLEALNEYISRCQSFLQAGQPDNDLLLYLPIFDLWATDNAAEHLLHFLTPHNTQHWLHENLPEFSPVADQLWERGYSFDFVSDRLLDQISLVEQQPQTPGAAYRALMVAGCRLLPVETLERIVDLARSGATVLFVGDLPQDVPGLAHLTERREHLRATLASLGSLQTIQPGIAEARVGAGRILVGSDAETMSQIAGIRRESVVDPGVKFVRRRDSNDYLYFLVNLSQQPLDQWISLPVQMATAIILDPLSHLQGAARIKVTEAGATDVYLQLDPGQSLVLRTSFQSLEVERWQYLTPIGLAYPIEGMWQVEFVEGGPALPKPVIVNQLTSWTEWPDDTEALRAFSGTAHYSITFDPPALTADAWAIDLGVVCHSAQVKLNGQLLGKLYARPFRIVLPEGVQAGSNHLEIEVTNLMANRLAHCDRQQQDWPKFFFVNIAYQPFDARNWEPLPSGLLGPVRLIPLRRMC